MNWPAKHTAYSLIVTRVYSLCYEKSDKIGLLYIFNETTIVFRILSLEFPMFWHPKDIGHGFQLAHLVIGVHLTPKLPVGKGLQIL